MQNLVRRPLRLGSPAFVLAAALFSAPQAQASDGLIQINGQITALTCSINVNGGGSNDASVTLPSVTAVALATEGARAGGTPFSITLSGCSPSGGNVYAHFEGPNIDMPTGTLINLASGGATHTNFQLSNANGTPLNLGAASQGSAAFAIDMGSATLTYQAWYIAVGGPATAGAVNSTVEYSLVYQ